MTSLWSVTSLALSCSLNAAAFASEAPAKAAEAPATAMGGAEKNGMLVKGMAADDVVKLIGQPATVTTLKMDKVKAEKWIYRKLVGQRVEQVATTVDNTPAFIGTGGQGANDLGTRPEIVYSLKHISTYQVTALLMINDHLDLARQWNEQRVSYEQ